MAGTADVERWACCVLDSTYGLRAWACKIRAIDVRLKSVHDAMTVEPTLMPRAIADSGRIELRIDAAAKAKLARAAALEHVDLTAFILRAALPVAENVIEQAERVTLSERDSLLVLELLENPPPPNAKLRRAAAAFAKRPEKRPEKHGVR